MFGETEYDPTRQFCSISMDEQLDALGRAVGAGKVSLRSSSLPLQHYLPYISIMDLQVKY